MARQRLHGNPVLLRAQADKRCHEVDRSVHVALIARRFPQIGPFAFRKRPSLVHALDHRAGIAHGKFLPHTSNHVKIVDRARVATASLHDLLVGDKPLAGHIAFAGFLLAPRRELARRAQLPLVELRHSFQATIAQARILTVLRGVHHLLEVGGKPPKASLRFELASHLAVYARKIDHVVGRIVDLRIGKRALRPIGIGVGFLERDAANSMHERPVANLLRMAEESRSHLRVKKGTRHRSHLTQKNLYVLPARVKELHRALVF